MSTYDEREVPRKVTEDVTIADAVDGQESSMSPEAVVERLEFDGTTLFWRGASPKQYSGFSGQADMSARESEKNLGPTPQGLYAVDPANIEALVPSDDWGSHRVRLEPYKSTVDRMVACFKVVRTGMYIHGGTVKGTSGCIELNDDADETNFFSKLASFGSKIELEVKFKGDAKTKLEESKCPY